MQKRSPGFDRVTMTHVEGHAAAMMRHLGIDRATLYINNRTICSSCFDNLPKMLPPGATLKIVLPSGAFVFFTGGVR
jgi:hypothetical protein